MQKVIDLLARCYEFDVNVLSQPWMYWLVFPAMFYMVFVFIKWTVLTCPLWLPLYMIIKSLRKDGK